MIGVPRYWRSTTLPAGHVWANGDLALFADWPELKKIYDAGGFAGMLLAYNANSATIAANLGKWRPNAANPTGLYVPKLSEQFFRGWTQGGSREAGAWAQDTVQVGINSFEVRPLSAADAPVSIEMTIKTRGRDAPCLAYGSNTAPMYRYESAQRQAAETCPVHIWQPCIIYLGNSA